MSEYNARVWITGMGLVASPGYGGGDFVATLSQRDRRFSPWPSDQPTPGDDAELALVSDYPKERYFTERQLRLTDRAMTIGTCAAGLALLDAGEREEARIVDPDEMATIFGSMRAEHSSTQKFSVPLFSGKPKALNAAQFPMIARNVACGQIAITFASRGMSSMMCAGPLSSLHAIARGADLVRRGRAPAALVGGIETLGKFSINHSRHLYEGALSGGIPRFFGQSPGRLVPGEGSAMLLLESAEHAQRRGARPYAEVVGAFAGRLGAAFDAASIEPQVSGFLAKHNPAGCTIADAWREIAMVSCGQSGAGLARDAFEMQLLEAVHQRHGIPLQVSAPRSWVGEAEAAASALQVQQAAVALRDRRLPATHCVEAATTASVRLHQSSRVMEQSVKQALVCGFDDAGSYSMLLLAKAG